MTSGGPSSRQRVLERHLLEAAAHDAIGAHFGRWMRFGAVQPGEWMELQALHVPTRYGTRNRFAHADSDVAAVRLLEEAERFGAQGLYVIANRINPAVASRREPRRWHDAEKNAGTSDRDILARRVIFIDIDHARPSGTSATDEEVERVALFTGNVFEHLRDLLGEGHALGYAHSGNGRQLFLAIDDLPESPELAATVRDILTSLAALHHDERVHIDLGVHDAKRLVPAFGTTKRKGAAGITDRPHRKTAFRCSETPTRISRGALERLRDALRGAAGRGAEGKPPARASREHLHLVGAPSETIRASNRIPVSEVATFLGMDLDHPVCPGCGNADGKFIAEGFKCHHQTCSKKGLPAHAGFRTPTMLAAEVRGVDEDTAARLLLAHFESRPRAAETPAIEPESDRVTVLVRPEEHDVNDEALVALVRADAPIFVRAGSLVHVVRDGGQLAGVTHAVGSPRIVSLPQPRLRELLAGAARWTRTRERRDGSLDEVPTHPPEWCVRGVHARGQWPDLRHLEAVVEVPVLRPDGTLLQTEGYDPMTGLLYLPGCPYPAIADAPTFEDAREACSALLEVVADFPFEDDAHRSTWLAAMLSPFARFAYRGPTPLFLVDANVRSAGKTKLVDVISEIAFGRPIPRYSQAEDDAEERKRITTIVLAGFPLVLIDNITRPLGTGALDAALTGEVWSDRALGRNENVVAPLLTVWYATGNNVQLAADTTRRCAHIRLQSPLENPETREDFRHPDLLGWVRENRMRLVVASATVLRAYTAAGRPSMGLPPWGSFEGWSSLVRNAVVWCGHADPGSAREELASLADREKSALADLLAGWEEIDPPGLGVTASHVLRELEGHPDRYERLRSAVAELIGTANGKLPSAKSFGSTMRHVRRRVHDGRFLDAADRTSPIRWKLFRAGAPPRPAVDDAPADPVAATVDLSD
jgi:hypothetical protein